jgi:ABC-2 type transport system permease protein
MNTIENLWGSRMRRFWREALQYWSYVGRSGFSLFLFILFIVGMYAYITTLKTLPTTYPYAWITTPVLLLALAPSPIRTFVKGPDTVFLLPAENQMKRYFRNAAIYSYILQAFITVVACLAVWPLYVHCESEQQGAFLLFIAALLIAKAAQITSAWHEGRMMYPHQRFRVQALRWILTAVFVFILFVQGPLLAFILLLLASSLMMLLHKRFDKHTIAWDYLIRAERKHLAAHYLFFSWFVDVPQMPVQMKHRMILTKITRYLRFTQSNTFLYLYTKTLLRGELFGILFRISILGMVLLAIITTDAARIVVYAIAIIISGVQISTLEQQHRYTFWLQLYPLKSVWRSSALAQIVFCILALESILLAAVFALIHGSIAAASLCLGVSLVLGFLYSFVIYPRKLRRALLQAQ